MKILAVAVLLLAGSVQDQPAIGWKTGQMIPDFTLPDLDGKTGKLSDYRGKKVFLFNFAAW